MIGLACSTLSIEGFSETNFDKTFETAPKIGFKRIEFNCWYPSSLTEKTIARLGENCRLAGLEPISIHLSGGLGGNITKDYYHKLRGMQAVRELGAQRLVATGVGRGAEGGTDSVINSLKALAPVAEELGVMICLENHVDNSIENIEDYRRILDAVDSKFVGICIDTGHFDAAGVDMDALIDEFFPRINHIHLKENNGVGVKRFSRFKEGTTDNDHIVTKMIDLGYSGYVSIELSPEIGDGRPFTLDDLKLPYDMFSVYEKGV